MRKHQFRVPILEPWQVNQYGIALAVFASMVGFTFVVPFLPLFLQQLGVRDLGEVALWAGVLVAAAPLVAALTAPLWGLLADRFGTRLMLLNTLAILVIILLLMGLAQSVFHLLVLRVAQGVFGGFTPLTTALMAAAVPPDRMARALGLLQSVRLISTAVGPAMGGFLADLIGMRVTYNVSAGLCVIAFMTIWRMHSDTPVPAVTSTLSPTSHHISVWKLGRTPALAVMAVVLFLTQSIDASFYPVLPLYLPFLGVPQETAASVTGLIIGMAAIAGAASAFAIGRVFNFGSPRMLIVTLLAGAIVCWPLVLVETSVQLLALRMLLGLVIGSSMTLALTMGSLSLPRDRQGVGMALLTAPMLLGNSLGPLAGGALAMINLRAVFVMQTLLFTGLALLLLLVRPTFSGYAGTDAPSSTL